MSTAGTYWVRVYSAGSCSTQSANILVTVGNIGSATPSITASGSLALTNTNPSVTLTSSSATSYLWSNGLMTRSVTVTTAGVYNVTVNGSTGCSAKSANVTVSKSGCTPPAIPTITLSGSPVLQAGQTVTLTSPIAGGYLWSTGAISRSIVVSGSGSYTVRNYFRK